VGKPEGNAVAERFSHALRVQRLSVQRCETVAKLLDALHVFTHQYNEQWVVARH
jgi:hypothetical protein